MTRAGRRETSANRRSIIINTFREVERNHILHPKYRTRKGQRKRARKRRAMALRKSTIV